ncbi:major facilitator superfamily domain-containing protein [Xylariaceae sp. FL0804]|nr:major facilitator superfamily domain-containing protein [Xylariaceae sp. FL0804]
MSHNSIPSQHTVDEKTNHDASAAPSPPPAPPQEQQLVANEAAKPPAADPNAPPDGGLTAWLQVLGGFMIFFNTWGLLNTFGVFQTYYESGQLFTASSSNISWVGAIQSYFVLLGGLVTGRLYDQGYLRSLIVVGAFGVVFGHMVLSLCHTFWQVLLAQGFVIGLGAGAMFTPGLAVIPSYFRKRMGLAIGLCASGSSMGGIIYPIVFYRLINNIGFGWSVRVLGFIALVTLLVPIAVLKQRVTPPGARAIFDWSIFTDLPFMFFIFGGLLGYIGLYVVFFYISYLGESTGILNESLSFYIIPILNAASMFGRTAPNAVADYTGPFNMVIPGAAICGILTFSLIAVNSKAGIIIIAIFFGFFSGVYIGMPPVLAVSLTEDKSKIGTRIGMAFAIIGLGVFAGGPGSGAILALNSTGDNWTGVWIFGGVVFFGSAVVQTCVRVHKTGFKFMVKA